MTQQNVPDLKELFRQAAEIAQQVPESMQEAAFNRALDLLVGETPPGDPAGVVKSARSPAAPKPERDVQIDADALLQQIDSTQHPGVRSATKVLDRSLMVLQIALRDHSVDGLTAVEIARILTDKFRLGTSRQAVGMALKDASNLVDRVPDGRGYRYRIMGPGEEYLAHLEDSDSATGTVQPIATTRKPVWKRRRSKATKGESSKSVETSDAATASSSKAPKAKRTPSSKLGPKAAIVALIESGFFADPKTGPEVQAYLKKKRGFDLGTDQLRVAMLRLVRDGVLGRDENDERQYEYKRP